jgi:hypothetical protein
MLYRFRYPGSVIIKILKPTSGPEHHILGSDDARVDAGWEQAGCFRAFPTAVGGDGATRAGAAGGGDRASRAHLSPPLEPFFYVGGKVLKGSTTDATAIAFWAYGSPGTPETSKYTVFEERGVSRCLPRDDAVSRHCGMTLSIAATLDCHCIASVP